MSKINKTYIAATENIGSMAPNVSLKRWSTWPIATMAEKKDNRRDDDDDRHLFCNVEEQRELTPPSKLQLPNQPVAT